MEAVQYPTPIKSSKNTVRLSSKRTSFNTFIADLAVNLWQKANGDMPAEGVRKYFHLSRGRWNAAARRAREGTSSF
jgi:hypothetical protein